MSRVSYIVYLIIVLLHVYPAYHHSILFFVNCDLSVVPKEVNEAIRNPFHVKPALEMENPIIN